MSQFSVPDPQALRERLTQNLSQRERPWKAIGIAVALLLVAGGWGYNHLRPTSSFGTTVAALPRASATTVADSDSPSSAGAGSQGASSSTPSVTAKAGTDVVVQVAGAVLKPGVYALSATGRVNDAVAIAGGPAADSDIDRVNLAAKLSDGQQIFVPRKGEALPAAPAGGSAATSDPVNLNTATVEQLDALPGVGPSTAQAIVDYREQHGAFKSVQGLNEVKGIGDAKFADLKNKVTV